MTIKERLAKLLTVKSIVTFLATLVFCYLAIEGVVDADNFMAVFITIIAFYFGTQAEKKNNE